MNCLQIKKFNDAIAKHGTERCSLGPAKGLEESELMSLALNRENNFSYPMLRSALPASLSQAGGTASSTFTEVEGRKDFVMA